MRSASLRAIAFGGSAIIALAAGSQTVAHAATGGGDEGRHVVAAKPSWTSHAIRTGTVSATSKHEFKVVLNLRNADAAEALATAVSTPGSAQYGKYISPSTFRHRFAPTAGQVKTVTAWLKKQGITVQSSPANHRYLAVQGSTKAINSAFSANLSTYKVDGAKATAPSSSLSVPQAVSSLVAGVTGLDSTAVATPSSTTGADSTSALRTRSSVKAATASTSTASTKSLPGPPDVFKNAGPCSKYYGQKSASSLPKLVKNTMSYAVCGYKPAQLRSAYGVDTQLANGIDGRGVTVAVVDAYAAPTIYQDAKTYAAKNDPSHPLRSYQFSQSLPGSYNSVSDCGGNGWYGEETLDVEAVHAMAPAANIKYVGASSCMDDDLDAAVNTVVDNKLATVITNSYGDAGEPTSLSDVAEEHQTAVQAALEGISLLFSSGDNGDEVADLGTRTVDYEASDPYVTAVGGTALNVTKTGSYGWEQGWGTGKSTLTNGKWNPTSPAYVYGGGGGTSKLFTQPGYQKGVVPTSISNYFKNGAHRAVPDVAMDADPQTGFLVGETQAFPNGKNKYSEYRIGGTSLASPLMAGVVAVADQAKGSSLGFLNPKLYKLAGTSALHDVNHGKSVTDAVIRVDYVNGVNAKDGTVTSARTLNQTGTIFTRKGYDDVTGVGTPNGEAFFDALS